MENIAGARKPAKREDEHTVAGEHRMMRRADREVTDPERIAAIIAACDIVEVAYADAEGLTIVPLNFGYAEENGKRVFYFHSAKSGRKLDLIAGTPSVGFELDVNYALVEGEEACRHTARFQSVIGTGRVSFVEEASQKEAALQALMLHNTGKDGWTFSGAMLDSVRVFKLEVETLSCKEHE